MADDPVAQAELEEMYRDGLGVDQDYVLAHMYINIAASQGYADASIARDELAEKMAKDQIANAQEMARNWLTEHSGIE